MGRDIHMHVEIKVNGKWLHYNQPKIQRHYSLFAKLVPMDDIAKEEAVAPERGLPEDITETTRFCYEYEKPGAHTASWLGIPEIGAVEEWYDLTVRELPCGFSDKLGWLFGNTFGWFLKYRKDYPKELEDARIVFWFDN